MGLNEWLTEAAIKAVIEKLQQPVKIGGLHDELDIVIFAAPKVKKHDDRPVKKVLGKHPFERTDFNISQ